MREILGIGLVLFCIPLLVPSWKWLAICTAIFLFANIALYVHRLYVAHSGPSYGSPGEGLGILFLMFFALCFFTGAAIKALYFFLKNTKKRTMLYRLNQPRQAKRKQ
ncbi:hypothetical protein [Pseudomonas sp.]|uniref:hypothetical protein n=1 Tax=Pseudomonas sp. TaxID=306 RepID=UPI003D13AEE9